MLVMRPRFLRSLSLRVVVCGAFALLLSSLGEAATAAEAPFIVRPAAITLRGNFDRGQLLVAAPNAKGAIDELSADLTTTAIYKSQDNKIVSVSSTGQLLAKANGKAKISVTVGPRTQDVEVEVVGVLEKPAISFVREVTPILSKTGCNSASCHASQHGKGGFKLSVFGYAPDEDYRAMVRDWQGRRVDLVEPEKSLIFMKPLLQVPHGGNKRLDQSSIEYQTLAAWLAGGAPAPNAKDAKVTGIAVTPVARVGTLGFTQQFRVEATYSDGNTRDVTALAKYDSQDEGTASVSATGLAKVFGKGQAPIVVRFEGQAQAVVVTVPYGEKTELKNWKNHNFIDELASAKFREVGIEPSGLCDDATFVRRAYLDAIGSLPTIEQTQAFLNDKSTNKRAELIDALLGLTGDPTKDVHNNAYAAYWSLKWADLIRSSSANVGEQGMWALHNWIQESFRKNKPYDQFVRELVLAKGSIYMDGPSNFYRIASNPPDMARDDRTAVPRRAVALCEVSPHTMEKYAQEDYYSFAAFFARVGTKNSSEFGLFGREQIVMVKNTGEVSHPKTGKVMVPTPLEGEPVAEALDRRQPLADWLVSSKNEYFSRNLVNRYMGYLMGRGLVEPIDDMRATNPSTNRPLLDALGAKLHRFGFRYQATHAHDHELAPLPARLAADAGQRRRRSVYSHYEVKRIGAESLLDSIDYVTGSQTKFKNMPLGTKAIELPDSNYPGLLPGDVRQAAARERLRV